MKNDEINKTNPVNENAGNSKNEKAKIDTEKQSWDEGMRKGVVTTSIISFLILCIAAIIVFFNL